MTLLALAGAETMRGARVPRLDRRSVLPDHKRDEARRYDQRRGSSSRRGYGARWRKLRGMILARQPYCQTEGCNEWATEVDHIVSKRDGGTDRVENLQGLCKSCHSRKTATEDGGWGE